ncbi:carbon-nitrogen hydrolase family protein [Mycobacterium sp. CBMA271]|uniref:carbon-nitrogen hydrolase family protein n=1 Tax=unclassified Mycobacteroides TaxID=2618759 RepID=UPI0012DD7365|nr:MULTISPECIES: carbon-nitrogen hydrolase family protein [unclassified Mycobacteroides]MUM18527.1 nitrilase [Mycobacteroides sp. CBMA 326]MUM23796.1 carbon-nitrogen hydrolase family protein [Mycobacteroides sp. CBMA 271]
MPQSDKNVVTAGGLSISTKLRVAGLQSAGNPANPDANLAELDKVAKRLAGQADLLITPELFVTGYDIGDRLPELVSTDHLDAVRSIAEQNKIAIIVGLAESATAGALYNNAVFIDERGAVRGRHQKTHLFGEIDRAYFTAGSQPVTVVQYRGVNIGVMICYDVEFPENARMSALAGAHLLAVPTAQMAPFEFVADVVIRARAWENQIYLAYINHDGVENATTYVGRSSIVGPDGDVLDRIESGTGTIIAEVDTEVVRLAQRANPYLADMRPELNSALTDRGSRVV